MLRPAARNLLRVLTEMSQLPPVPAANMPPLPLLDAGVLKHVLNISDSTMATVIQDLEQARLVSVEYPTPLGYGEAVPRGTTVRLSSLPDAVLLRNDSPRCPFRHENDCPAFEGWLDHEVFVVGPSDLTIARELSAVKDAIRQLQLDPYVALDDPATHAGQDAMCTMICRKIIECRFTVVLLTAPEERFDLASGTVTKRLPRPNVYTEYGIAVGIGRPSIPARRQDQQAEFDIATIQAITYDQNDLSVLTEQVRAAGSVLLGRTPNWHTAVSDADRCISGTTTLRSWIRDGVGSAVV